MKLTDEQRKRVEWSAWIVNTVLKEQGLSWDMDLKQEAALWLCKCAQRFDPARGVKWSTYAYRSVYLRIKRLHDIRRINEAKRYDYECKTAEVGFSIEDGSAARIMCEKIAQLCDEQELSVLRYRYEGYTWDEVTRLMRLSHCKVAQLWKSICAKARGEKKNE